MGLVTCPFCRELFEKNEAKACPVCGLNLTDMDKLPLSHDAAAEALAATVPEQEDQPWTYVGRSRGPLLLLAALGVVLFFLPWVHYSVPRELDLTGFHFARLMLWPGFTLAAWMVMIPTVLSRRSILRMRMARVPVTFLAAMPALTVLALSMHRDRGVSYYTTVYHHTFAFWATLALSAVAVVFAVRFGGKLDDIELRKGSRVSKAVARTADETLH